MFALVAFITKFIFQSFLVVFTTNSIFQSSLVVFTTSSIFQASQSSAFGMAPEDSAKVAAQARRFPARRRERQLRLMCPGFPQL